MNATNAIELRHVSRSFGDFALSDVSFELPSGCILGLMGENGAGKSTTLRLIMNTLRRDAGEIRVLGADNTGPAFREIKEDIGVVLDEAHFPEVLTVRELRRVLAGTYRNWDGEAFQGWLRRFDLPEKKAFKNFSRGMKMKLAIAAALSHRPKLLLLDEHTAALDPAASEKIMQITKEIVTRHQLTTMMITHNLNAALQTGNRTIMMDSGKLILDISGKEREQLSLQDLLALYSSKSNKAFDNDRMLLT